MPVRVVLPRSGCRSRRQHSLVPPSLRKPKSSCNAIKHKRAVRISLPLGAICCGRSCDVGIVSYICRPHGTGACVRATPICIISVPGRTQ